MPKDRTGGRTVHLFLSSNVDVSVGGCGHDYFNQHDLYVLIEILIVPQAVPPEGVGSMPDGRAFAIHKRGSPTSLEDSAEIELSPGDYIISPKHGTVTLLINDEPFLNRVFSHSITPRDREFRKAVRDRDGGCVISGTVNEEAEYDDWGGFQAAHIWPLARGDEWNSRQVARFITDSDGLSDNLRMNSPQNGILLRCDIHQLFNQHDIAVNPEDDYKIYIFRKGFGLEGKKMKATARENGDVGARDALLMWHFRQSVFANMRGPGEPTWDYGPREPGDVVGRLLTEDHTMTRLGDEVAARLALTPYLPLSP